MDKSLLDKLKK